MVEPKEPVTIVFSANDYHAMLLGVALCSLFENKHGDYPVRVFVFDGGISAENKKRLGILEQNYGFSIMYATPDPSLFVRVPIRDRPVAAYYRIVIARFLPADFRRVLYLDCDVMVRGDVAELFYFDLAGKTVAAVPDCFPEEQRKHLRHISGKDGVYFNSGVMLIDLDRWKRHDVERQLFSFIHEHPDKLKFDDQDPLNVVFREDYAALPTTYNVMAGAPANPDGDPNPFVVHFSGGAKPWYLLSSLRYQGEWVDYANMTPWRDKKYRKIMDVYFAHRHHVYPVAWWTWRAYKRVRSWL